MASGPGLYSLPMSNKNMVIWIISDQCSMSIFYFMLLIDNV